MIYDSISNATNHIQVLALFAAYKPKLHPKAGTNQSPWSKPAGAKAVLLLAILVSVG